MTFIDQPKGNSRRNKKTKAADSLSSPNQQEEYGDRVENIGLTGGQSEDSRGGVDMSQYTGPKSKPSSVFNNPEAEFKTGPGNGLSSEKNQDQQKDKLGKQDEHV